jgi:Zn-dependent protease
MRGLQLRFLGFPLHVQPGFLLLALLISSYARTWQHSLSLVVVVVVSLLVHELGHAIAARSFGQQPSISLHMMGGLTSWVPTREIGRARSLIVTAAGPLSGFALGLLALAVSLATAGYPRDALRGPSIALWTVDQMWIANFFWSAINLLPVLPFDGGQLLAIALGRRRRRLSSQLSLVFGAIAGVALWRIGQPLAGIVFGIGGLMSYLSTERQLKALESAPPEGWEELLRRARTELDGGRLTQAAHLARAVAEHSQVSEQRRAAREIMAWSAVMAGDASGARAALAELGTDGSVDVLLQVAVDEAAGSAHAAVERLEHARRNGDARPEVLAALIRVLLKSGEAKAAAELTAAAAADLDADDARRVAAEVEHDAPAAAARIWRRLFELHGSGEDAFDAARVFARAGDTTAAFQTLAAAVRSGIPVERVRVAPDFIPLRNDPAFERALSGDTPP